MKPTYNKTKIMRNAWYLKRVEPAKCFGECLRKAWRNEKQALITAMLEARAKEEFRPNTMPSGAAFEAGCIAYYTDARNGQYLGD